MVPFCGGICPAKRGFIPLAPASAMKCARAHTNCNASANSRTRPPRARSTLPNCALQLLSAQPLIVLTPATLQHYRPKWQVACFLSALVLPQGRGNRAAVVVCFPCFAGASYNSVCLKLSLPHQKRPRQLDRFVQFSAHANFLRTLSWKNKGVLHFCLSLRSFLSFLAE